MAGPSNVADVGHGFPDPSLQPTVRCPAVAGMFYPEEPDLCRQQAQSYLHPSHLAGTSNWLGALVPHAGWVCSGMIAGQSVRQEITLQQGISTEKAREIVKAIKDSKKKVQASIQGDLVRVSGKDRDALQEIIGFLREREFGIDMQFTNYRSN